MVAAFPLLVLCYVHIASAAPAGQALTIEAEIQQANGNNTVLNTEIAPSWATTPNIRGTGDLLWTSILTLVICVYTVIHLNIPPPDEGRMSLFLRKAKWVVTCIIAPEIGLAMAIQQWFVAKALSKDLTKLWTDSRAESLPDKRKKKHSGKRFGMVYGHYAAMGGFVADVSSIHNTKTFITLLPPAIYELAQCGFFLEMEEKSIKDRSKADTLAKLLVCVQVVWMLIQCVGRKVAGLPISLLEVHVLVHVACALIMYALWIEKPLDVQEPTLVDSSHFQNMLGLILLRNDTECKSYTIQTYGDFASGARYSTKQYATNSSLLAPSSAVDIPLKKIPESNTQFGGVYFIEHSDSNETIVNHTAYRPLQEDLTKNCVYGMSCSNPVCILYPGQSLNCGIGPPADGKGYMKLSSKDVLQWTLASAAMKDHPEIYPPGTYNFDRTQMRSKVSKRAKNFGNFGFSLDVAKSFDKGISESPWFMVMMILCHWTYGGVHLSTLRFHFPTPTERLLWKISSIVIIAGFPGAWALMAIFFAAKYMVSSLFHSISKFLLRFRAVWRPIPGIDRLVPRVTSLSLLFYYLVLFFLFLVYLSARIFLIVESFISVRSLPVGVFVTVSWSTYIPHL